MRFWSRSSRLYRSQPTRVKLGMERYLWWTCRQRSASEPVTPVLIRFEETREMKKIWLYTIFCLTAGVSTVAISASASAEVSAETAFIFNTLSFLMHGFLVMWMAAGFCMLEAGLVRSKNTTMQCSKNIGCLLYTSDAADE